nr:hypothetical protein [Tanacetum cinerariifolium]
DCQVGFGGGDNRTRLGLSCSCRKEMVGRGEEVVAGNSLGRDVQY